MNTDSISLQRIQSLHPKIRDKALAAYQEASAYFAGKNIRIRITHGLRTWEEQTALYNQGRTTPGKKVTNAKAGSSYHNYGLALDCCLLYDVDGNGTYETVSWNEKKDFDGNKQADWLEMVKFFIKHGFAWGGNWKTMVDLPHFEMTFDKNWKQLKDLYERKQFIPGTAYVNF